MVKTLIEYINSYGDESLLEIYERYQNKTLNPRLQFMLKQVKILSKKGSIIVKGTNVELEVMESIKFLLYRKDILK